MNRTARIPEHILQEIRAGLPLRSVVERLVSLKRSGATWSGRCPIHNGASNAFHIYPDQHFHCFSCGAHGDVIGFVMQTERCTFPEAAARCAQEAGVTIDIDPGERRIQPPPPREAPPQPDRSADIARAGEWWRAAEPIRSGSVAAAYLAGRRLWPLPPSAHEVLRLTDLQHPETGRALHPVMLARVDDASGALTAVHRTYLARLPGGGAGKLDGVESSKLVFGVLPPGAAIRLFPPAPEMGAAEGIETALAAARLAGLPVWSTIAANRLEDLVPPSVCRDLTIFADRDKPRTDKVWRPEGQGMHSARVLAGRLPALGVAGRIRLPLPPAKDYADVLMSRGQAA